MLPEIENLLVLQDKDQKIRMLSREQEAIPFEKQGAASKLAAATAAVEKAALAVKQNEVELRNLQLEAETKRTSIGRFKSQQFETRKNEEYQALSHEITRFEADIVRIEDKELEIMEAAELLKAALATAQKELAAQKHQVDVLLAVVEKKAVNLAERLEVLKSEREAAWKSVPEDLAARYERLLKTKGDSAVASLEHEVCMGCHVKVTTQTIARVKAAKEIVNCDQCGRILYWQP